MLKFVKRNIPVVVIGIIIMIVFIWASLARQESGPTSPPILKRVAETDVNFTPEEDAQNPILSDEAREANPYNALTPSSISKYDEGVNYDPYPELDEGPVRLDDPVPVTDNRIQVGLQPDSAYQSVDSTHGPILISYDLENGFTPEHRQAYLNQLVLITNRSQKTLIFAQVTKKTVVMDYTMVKIEPQETLRLRLKSPGLWIYSDAEEGLSGSIYIYEN